MSFYDTYEKLCQEKGVKPGRAAQDCGINRSNVTSWKNNGYAPRGDALKRIADYFEVTTDFLLGQEDKEKPLINGDEELTEYLDMLRSRPECRMLFQISKNATKADVEAAVRIIEALMKKD